MIAGLYSLRKNSMHEVWQQGHGFSRAKIAAELNSGFIAPAALPSPLSLLIWTFSATCSVVSNRASSVQKSSTRLEPRSNRPKANFQRKSAKVPPGR